jgi:hypothetical protein
MPLIWVLYVNKLDYSVFYIGNVRFQGYTKINNQKAKTSPRLYNNQQSPPYTISDKIN